METLNSKLKTALVEELGATGCCLVGEVGRRLHKTNLCTFEDYITAVEEAVVDDLIEVHEISSLNEHIIYLTGRGRKLYSETFKKEPSISDYYSLYYNDDSVLVQALIQKYTLIQVGYENIHFLKPEETDSPFDISAVNTIGKSERFCLIQSEAKFNDVEDLVETIGLTDVADVTLVIDASSVDTLIRYVNCLPSDTFTKPLTVFVRSTTDKQATFKVAFNGGGKEAVFMI